MILVTPSSAQSQRHDPAEGRITSSLIRKITDTRDLNKEVVFWGFAFHLHRKLFLRNVKVLPGMTYPVCCMFSDQG